jgi:hypothetical protein
MSLLKSQGPPPRHLKSFTLNMKTAPRFYEVASESQLSKFGAGSLPPEPCLQVSLRFGLLFSWSKSYAASFNAWLKEAWSEQNGIVVGYYVS